MMYNVTDDASVVIANYYRYYKTFAQSGIVDFHAGPVSWIMPKSGENGPSLAFDIRLDAGTAEEVIQEHIKGIHEKKVPGIWFITPDAKPDDILDVLEQNGFRNLSGDTDEPGMLLNKEDFQPYIDKDDSIVCRKVQSKDDFCIWVDVVNTALHGWKMIDADNYYIWAENGVYDFYLGEIDGIPVSTAATIRSGDTASLEFVSTLSDYRRRKAAITISSKAICGLFENGAETVTLSGAAEAVSLYQKLGFHKCFTNVLVQYDIS